MIITDNGIVDKEDAVVLLKHISLSDFDLTETQTKVANVNNDSNNDMLDVINILKVADTE